MFISTIFLWEKGESKDQMITQAAYSTKRIAQSALLTCAIVTGGSAYADMTDFDTSLTILSGSEFQVDSVFSILYDLNVVHLDFNNDNVPDQDMTFGAGNFLGEYLDPQNYVLDFALPGSGDTLKPYYLGSELSGAANVDWRLSYVNNPGDPSSIYSTIMSGSADSIAGVGLTLNITGGLEWPVSGWGIPDVGIPIGTHWAADIADFDSFTFTYGGGPGNPFTLSANVVPAPGAMALLGLGAFASRRRRS